MRQFIIRCLLWLIERDISTYPQGKLTKEQFDGLLSQLWQNPGFRQYVADRNQHLIYTMAGAPGDKKEPRDRYMELRGQRVEILELAAKAKNAFARGGPKK
jgi:hypothetical protein